MPRISDYWTTNSVNPIHTLVSNHMSRSYWEQIKRYLKIPNPNETFDTQGPDWWKKLEPLVIEFRKASQKYWIPGSHVSVDEQLILFKGRSCHTMQIASKAAGIGFKVYSLCDNNYLFDFLFSSKVRRQNA